MDGRADYATDDWALPVYRLLTLRVALGAGLNLISRRFRGAGAGGPKHPLRERSRFVRGKVGTSTSAINTRDCSDRRPAEACRLHGRPSPSFKIAPATLASRILRYGTEIRLRSEKSSLTLKPTDLPSSEHTPTCLPAYLHFGAPYRATANRGHVATFDTQASNDAGSYDPPPGSLPWRCSRARSRGDGKDARQGNDETHRAGRKKMAATWIGCARHFPKGMLERRLDQGTPRCKTRRSGAWRGSPASRPQA